MKKILTTLSLITTLSSPMIQQSAQATVYEPSKVVVGTDDRARVSDTTQPPYQSIVALDISYSNKPGTYLCTGTVIAPNKVITAAHCIYGAAKGGFPSKINVTPGQDNSIKPYGTFTSTHWHVPQEYINNENANHDIAVIDVDKNGYGYNIGDIVTQQNIEETNDFVGKDITITGYPGDMRNLYGTTQWTDHGVVKSQKNNRFNYDVDTMGGQSGSAVFNNETGNIIGIHTSGGGDNSATQINTEIYAWLQGVL